MSEITLVEAVTQALAHELQTDERVMLLGEDIGANGGVFRATAGLQERFGTERVVANSGAIGESPNVTIMSGASAISCSELVRRVAGSLPAHLVKMSMLRPSIHPNCPKACTKAARPA